MRKPVTNQQFDAKLIEIIDRNLASALLGIAGVYELVAEDLNNEVLQEIAQEIGHDVEREG